MIIHYEQKTGRSPMFRVKYRFLTESEGGRKSGPPCQGYISDFGYASDLVEPFQLYMIRPDFEDDSGTVLLYDDKPVPAAGTARMWIVNPEMIPIHRDRIKNGIKGYFMEGATKVAICEVIEILDTL